jgi:hypothetical protein
MDINWLHILLGGGLLTAIGKIAYDLKFASKKTVAEADSIQATAEQSKVQSKLTADQIKDDIILKWIEVSNKTADTVERLKARLGDTRICLKEQISFMKSAEVDKRFPEEFASFEQRVIELCRD